VTVESAQFGNESVPGEEFVVVVHKTTSGGYGDRGKVGAKVGESAVLSSGTHENITVELVSTLGGTDNIARFTSSQPLVAMLHLAGTTNSDDGGVNYGPQITRDEDTVTSHAQITALPRLFDVSLSDLPGNGDKSDPYEIAHVSELQAMEDDLDANYELVSDIDASQTKQFNNGSGFDPVGGDDFNESTPPEFRGSFDGSSHTIAGLAINRSDTSNVGLFGYVNAGAIITNVTLTNLSITGDDNVGGLVGSGGTIRNATATGNVIGDKDVGGLVGSGGRIRNATAAVDVAGERSVGGLVGSGGGIRNATASGSVNGTEEVGGLVGKNFGTIRNATAAGSVNGTEEVGGLVGKNFGTIRNATAAGSVNGTEEVGGLVGKNFGTIRNATAAGHVTGNDRVGGLVGEMTTRYGTQQPLGMSLARQMWVDSSEATVRSTLAQQYGTQQPLGMSLASSMWVDSSEEMTQRYGMQQPLGVWRAIMWVDSSEEMTQRYGMQQPLGV
jgi:The GLUG motif.